jgi:hypothetical protein
VIRKGSIAHSSSFKKKEGKNEDGENPIAIPLIDLMLENTKSTNDEKLKLP